jgi:hypothetical protein
VEPYVAALRDLPAILKETRELTRDNPNQQRRLDEVEPLAAHKLAELKRTVELRRSAGFEQTVEHTLDLGKKSQQIGSILQIIDELSEQTNILSINASIEAAGAGEMGHRFGVVAEEIRKLADRVGGSTKEIRALIDDIRAAVNTTVMATESGAKAVDAGRPLLRGRAVVPPHHRPGGDDQRGRARDRAVDQAAGHGGRAGHTGREQRLAIREGDRGKLDANLPDLVRAHQPVAQPYEVGAGAAGGVKRPTVCYP